MLPLGLDQSVRSLVESPVYVVPNEGNASLPGDTFDSHLGRSSDDHIARTTNPENGAREEQSDDERDREEVAAVAAPNGPVQPQAQSPPETREDSESDSETSDPDAIPSIENKSEDSSLGESHEKLLELKAQVANPSAKSKADNRFIERPAENSGHASDSTKKDAAVTLLPEAPSELAVAELLDVEPKTVDVAKLVAANEPFRASLDGEPTVMSDSLPVMIGDETEEASAPKSINPASAKSDGRKPRINLAELAPSNAEPTKESTGSNPVVAETGGRVRESSDSAVVERRDPAAITAPATSVDRDPGATTNSAAHRLVQHLSGGSEERASRASGLAGTDQTRFVDRVARAFRAAENRQGVVKLRLHPPELGSLRIELRMQNGVLTAKLEAETAMTQSLLIEHAHALRDRLSEQGVRVERFDVDLADRRSMDHSSNFQDRSQREKEPANHTQREQQVAAQTNTRPVPLSSSPASPGKINVIV